jgi:hypothetical protein
VANFTRVSYEICAWRKCGRLWVRHRERKGFTCSPSCGQALRQEYRASRRPTAAAAVDGMHDTELCAWWEHPYCDRRANKRDLCGNHYATARRRGELPPTGLRRPSDEHSLSVDSDGVTTCSVCGPLRYVPAYGRCPLSQRAYVLREKYGLTLADYDNRLIALGNRCSMCSRPPGSAGLLVDHCHAEGHPRDLVCMSCNVLLGYVEGDLDRVRLALRYVDRYRRAGAFS